MEKTSISVRSKDNTRLCVYSWLPDQKPKAIIALVHGLGEYHRRYEHVAAFYNSNQIGVYAIDLRGHGESEGKRGHTPSLNHFLDDIAELLFSIRKDYTETPVILYGHSMGGNLSLNFLLNHPSSEIKAAIITSPWLRLSHAPKKSELILAGIMQKIYPSFSQSNGLDESVLSRDPEIGRTYVNDPLVHDKISAGLFKACHASGEEAIRKASDLNLPTLLMHGTDDRVTSYEASVEFARNAGDLVTLKLWEDFRHETHNEIGKEDVLEFQKNWLEKYL
jgi:alpha-beta hydrolase superfamily lysophospholipase